MFSCSAPANPVFVEALWRGLVPILCGRYGNEVDHKVRNPVHDDDRPENLWVLCRWHHQRKTEGESAEVRRAKGRSRREKRWYSHPAFK